MCSVSIDMSPFGVTFFRSGKDIKIKLDVELNRKIVGFLRKNFDYDVLSEEESDGEDFMFIFDGENVTTEYPFNLLITNFIAAKVG